MATKQVFNLRKLNNEHGAQLGSEGDTGRSSVVESVPTGSAISG